MSHERNGDDVAAVLRHLKIAKLTSPGSRMWRCRDSHGPVFVGDPHGAEAMSGGERHQVVVHVPRKRCKREEGITAGSKTALVIHEKAGIHI